MSRNISVLIVEDNHIDAHITESILKNADKRIQTIICSNGENALIFLEEHVSNLPDFILLDINMPIMDGKEFLKVKATLPRLKDLPVIMLSSSGLTSEKNECYELGAVSFIEKPISKEVMQENVQLKALLAEPV